MRGSRLLPAAAALLAIAGAALVAVETGMLTGHSFDQHAVVASNRLVLRHEMLLRLARDITWLGAPVVVDVVTAVVAIALLARHRTRDALFVVGVRVAATVLAVILKPVIHRARPVLVHPVAHATGFSFPSGHALDVASTYLPLAVVLFAASRPALRWAGGAAAVGLCLLVATSRVLLGLHYPSDVIAGLALGGALTALGWALVRSWPGRGLRDVRG